MRSFISSVLKLRGVVFVLLMLLCCYSSSISMAESPSEHLGALFRISHGSHNVVWVKKTAPTDADCRQQTQQPCYSPQELYNAYNINPLLQAGYNGQGQTIVIVDSFGSPTIKADLKQFDADYGLSDPPSFDVLTPLGSVPFDSKNDDMVGWAQETSLDVEWAHAIAPRARIVLLTSPVSETEGVQGMPEFLKLSQYALNHHLGNVFSESWGATEETLFTPAGKQVISGFEDFYRQAIREHITILASAGDAGVLNPDVNGNNYPLPTVSFPASSPLVTAVGGTTLNADTNGTYQSETVWNDGPGNATGGGFSEYFRMPSYQTSLLSAANLKLSNDYRGLPDVAYDGDSSTSIPVYLGFMPDAGYYQFGGTSAGTPQWAGLIAIANQKAGHPLGFLNNKLYKIAQNPVLYASAFHDITQGNNSQGSVIGYNAGPGWDPTTGLGSPIATGLVDALINH